MSAEKPTDEQPLEGEQQAKPAAKTKPAAAKKPAAEKTPADKPAAKKPVAKAVAEDESAAGEKPAAKKPATKKPVAKKPAAEKTTVVDAEKADTAKAEKSATTESEKPAAVKAGKSAAAPEAEQPASSARREAKSAAPAPRHKVVRAQARYVRTSARKARMVCGHLRGKSVGEARAILAFTPREVARDWSKLLESAVANAENNHELIEDDLLIREAYADEGPTIKRFRPRAQGRATPIRKRTSHLTITLTPKP
jgi:ribosomal protein L22